MSAPIQFKRAVRTLVHLKALIIGPSGGGKTLGALRVAQGLATPDKIALADSENDRSLYYADRETFDHISLPDFHPKTYMAAINAAVAGGYEVVILDSLTHAWQNILDRKDTYDKANPREKFTSWNTFGGEWIKLVQHILHAPIHVIGTARSKQAFEKDATTNKIDKLGLQPILREGTEYEFALVFDLTQTHAARATKDNTGRFDLGPTTLWDLCDGRVAAELKDWLAVGKPLPQPSAATLVEVANTFTALEEAGDDKVETMRARWQASLRKGLEDAAAKVMLDGLKSRLPQPPLNTQDNPVTADTQEVLEAALERLAVVSTTKVEEARSSWNLSETKTEGFARQLIASATQLADQARPRVA